MKNYNKIYTGFTTLLVFGLLLVSCSDDILQEEPKSFLTPSNALTNLEGFQAAIAEQHRLTRGLRTSETVENLEPIVESDKAITTVYANGTDLSWFVVISQNQFTDYSLINATNPFVKAYWRILYKIVANSNTILGSLESVELEENVKLEIEGKARFFRAFAYRYLVYLYGAVPILEEEINSPKFDFVRDSKGDVLDLMKNDFSLASTYLPRVNPGDGSLSKAAADHFLAETLISLGDYDAAINAASSVIDDAQYELMESRFGEFTNLPGDVFWDLFRTNNQNRVSGNKESIWVWQQDFQVPNGNPRYGIVRAWSPLLERLNDSEGNDAYVPADTLGRGVGFVKPTLYLDSLIWLSDFTNDIRNSKYNMQRRFFNNNPASPEFGELINPLPSDLDRNHFVFVKKASSPEGYVQGYDNAGNLYTDIYALRLAETYLIRAEAHFYKGDLANAAADINIIRNRAKASPITPSQIDLDFILDERARELVVEEPRRLTLSRLGVLVDRVKKYNPVSAPSIQDFHNLWPIPQDEIDANILGELTQNPGY